MSKRSHARLFRLQDHDDDDAAIEAYDNKLKTFASVHKVDVNSPNAGWDLAIALAQAHIPGLRISSGWRGRKPTWLAGLGESLRREVNDTKEQSKCTLSKAIALLRADKSKLWSKYPPQTLAARYRDASRRYRSASQRDRIVLALIAREAVAKGD